MGLKGQIQYSVRRSEEGIPGGGKHRDSNKCVKLQKCEESFPGGSVVENPHAMQEMGV